MQSYSSDYSSQGATIIAAAAKIMLNPKVAIPLATTIFSVGTSIGYAWHQGKKEINAILTSNPERLDIKKANSHMGRICFYLSGAHYKIMNKDQKTRYNLFCKMPILRFVAAQSGVIAPQPEVIAKTPECVPVKKKRDPLLTTLAGFNGLKSSNWQVFPPGWDPYKPKTYFDYLQETTPDATDFLYNPTNIQEEPYLLYLIHKAPIDFQKKDNKLPITLYFKTNITDTPTKVKDTLSLPLLFGTDKNNGQKIEYRYLISDPIDISIQENKTFVDTIFPFVEPGISIRFVL